MNAESLKINVLTSSQQHNLLEALDPRVFHLIISPTEHCNFRCIYCYETFEKGRMEPSIVKGLKYFLDAKIPNLRKLTISWFGGEPLLARDLCYDIANHAFSLCKYSQVELSGNFTTNGSLLTEDWVKKFLSVKQDQFQITLDGDHEFHDKVRPRVDKKGTFHKIWENLVALHETELPFKILLRLHVRQTNEDSLSHLINRAKQQLQGDKRFQFGFHEVEDLGGPNTGQFEISEPQYYKPAVDRLMKQLRPEFVVQDMCQDDLLHICYASKPNSLFIRPNGTIGKCTVALDDDLNRVGELHEDGQIYVSEKKLNDWSMGFKSLDKQTLSCPLAALHHKACEKCSDSN